MYKKTNETSHYYLNKIEKLESLKQFIIQLSTDFILVDIMTFAVFGMIFLMEPIPVLTEKSLSSYFITMLLVFYTLLLSFKIVKKHMEHPRNTLYAEISEVCIVIFLLCYLFTLDESKVIPWVLNSIFIVGVVNIIAIGVSYAASFFLCLKTYWKQRGNCGLENAKTAHESLPESILIHEAGHACMAALLGVTVKEIRIGSNSGCVEAEMDLFNNEMVEKYVLINYAGFLAERIYRQKENYFSQFSEADIQQASEVINQFLSRQNNGNLFNRSNFPFKEKSETLRKECELYSSCCEEKGLQILKDNKMKLEQTIWFLQGKRLVKEKEWSVFWSEISQSEIKDKR